MAGERVGSVDAPEPVNHGQRGEATNQSAHKEGIV